MSDPVIVGRVELLPLPSVKPNPWNPNRMTPFLRASLREGLSTDGWLSSQALLIWGKDNTGKRRNLIIDGEHRWTIASELGMERGPMVVLDGLDEKAAKALTIKMNQKRGTFDSEKLGELLRSIQGAYNGDDALALSLGIDEDALLPLLAEPEVVLPGAPLEERPPAPAGSILVVDENKQTFRNVQLFYGEAEHAEYIDLLSKASTALGTATNVETLLQALRHAHRTSHPTS